MPGSGHSISSAGPPVATPGTRGRSPAVRPTGRWLPAADRCGPAADPDMAATIRELAHGPSGDHGPRPPRHGRPDEPVMTRGEWRIRGRRAPAGPPKAEA